MSGSLHIAIDKNTEAENQVISFGCRLNAYESEVIKKNLQNVEEKTIVFNTCAVTKEAERQARQAIRKTRRNNPNARIVVTGCSAQISPETYNKMTEVDLVLGNNEKFEPGNFAFTANEDKVKVNDIMQVKQIAPHMLSSYEERTRAFVQVQNGCNHRCTFCVIPYGRGNSRSVAIGSIVQQINLLVINGCKEVVLTGVDITDYGLDLPGKPRLGQMIKRVFKLCPDLPRLRLSSIDVAEIDDDLIELIKNEPRLMPYFHISLQSGDDMILKRMKRRHSRQDVINFCNLVRKYHKFCSFGADIIAGFPTESQEMFNNSLRLVEQAGLQFLHVFPYSPHEITPSAKMPQIPIKVRKERAAILRDAGQKELLKYLRLKLGCVEQCVVEENNIGRCPDFVKVNIKNNKPIIQGQLIDIKLSSIDSDGSINGYCI